MRASISTLSIACARKTCCSTAFTVWPSSSGSTARMCVGWCMYDRASVMIGAGHGGGEQHGLPAGRHQPDDLLDVGQEAQVEHLVGLVEHQGAHVAEVEVALLGQVDQPSGRTDDDLDALAQGLDLRLVRPAAVDREQPHGAAGRRLLEVAGHLDAQLAGRHHDERLRLARGGRRQRRVAVVLAVEDDPLEQRDAEAERLAGAGLGLADDVVPVQGDREGQRLDRERVGDADRLERLDRGREHAEVGERGDSQDGALQSTSAGAGAGRRRGGGRASVLHARPYRSLRCGP